MNKLLIIKCNRMFPDIIIEQYRQDIMKKMEDGVVVLPPGFELAEVNVELLEQIKTEIEKLEYESFECNLVLPSFETLKIIDKHIAKLKGENNG